jgi:hypothetical protein
MVFERFTDPKSMIEPYIKYYEYVHVCITVTVLVRHMLGLD